MFRILSFLVLFSFITSAGHGQAITDIRHQQQLKEFRQKADALYAKNLNRFGLDQLQQYDKTLDVLYAREAVDTLQAIRTSFEQSNARMEGEFKQLKNRKTTLQSSIDGFNNGYTKQLTKATILLLILSAVFISVLVMWRKRLLNQQQETALYQAKLKSAHDRAADGEELISKAVADRALYHELDTHLKEISRQSDQFQLLLSPEMKNGTWKEFLMHLKKINQQLISEETKNAAIVEFSKQTSEERTTADINQLCLHYFELVRQGFKTSEEIPAISATTDLEKNLPKIKVVPAAIGHLLIHVLTNAMQSVEAKAMKNTKGYVPKVALSTRILPRFLQIRIHDNGDGIDDKFMNKIKDAFFTLRQDEDAGLGLYISNLIMKNHQGEIKIESDKSRGTDIYLKFFIN